MLNNVFICAANIYWNFLSFCVSSWQVFCKTFNFRQLRTQKRIKLHLCLFLSFIITSFVTILWDFIVYLNRLENDREDTIMHQSTVGIA